jgi:dihydrofolate reductase
MARLIYLAISSLDGYIEDTDGDFGWAMPSDEVHSYINNLLRAAGTFLYGRRMYETMMGWETDPSLAAMSPIMADFAEIWQTADKIVYSQTLEIPSTRRTTIALDFDPEVVRQIKETARGDIYIGGPNLAAQAFRTGLIDEVHLLLAPVIVGGGKPCLPDNMRVVLKLLETRRFEDGMVHLHYRTKQI